MNNKSSNPFLKKLISEIANKANEGRINDLNWGVVYEAKKKSVKEAATPAAPKAGEENFDDILGGAGGGDQAPAAGAAPAATAPAAGEAPAADAAAPAAGADASAADAAAGGEGGDEDAAKADAVKAKAELEKAKAEKDKAEEELEDVSYIKLKSNSGVRFLLGKILDVAFKSNTIDTLAAEMVQKLNIKTPDDIESFSKDVSQFMVLPGMPQLLDSMTKMAQEKPSDSEEDTKTDSGAEGSDEEPTK